MKTHCLEVTGDYACFTRPEMKVERVSYDVITPSAARAVFEAILWKPAIRWHIRRIEVLHPIRWINLRRNEVGARISARNAQQAMKDGSTLAINIEDERQQRAGLFLREVKYRLHADMEVLSDEPAGKYHAMFERRAAKGQCFNQPYLGCREFAAAFRLVDPGSEPAEIDPCFEAEKDLGWMLYDLDYSDPAKPMPRFFQARLAWGVLDVPDWNSEEIRG